MNCRAMCLALLTAALATSCSGSSSNDEAAAPSASPSVESAAPATPMPDVVKSPAPAGFPVGTYGRQVSFAARLDGKWTLALNSDGTYLISRVSGDEFAGSYDVPATGRMVLHGESCPAATYTYKTTSGGVAFVDTGDCDDEDLHALMNGEWLKA